MRVDIKTISRNIGASLEINTTCSPEEIALSFQEYEFSQPVEFDGIVSNTDKDVLVLKGIVSTVLESKCARCLKDVVLQIEAKIDVTFRARYSRDPQTQDNADPEEEYTYEGYSIELDRVLRDSLILALPYKVLCVESCKGICEWCGGNMNERDCKCKDQHESGKSLFEELRNLL